MGAVTTESKAPPMKSGRVNEVFAATVLSGPDGGGLGDGDFRILVIGHGATQDGRRYYGRQALEQAVSEGVFDGVKMFLNHSDPLNDGRRGHRDVRDYCATVKPGSLEVTERGLEGVCHVHSGQLREMLVDPVARGQIGISHDSFVRYRVRQVDGREVQAVQSIQKCNSVDWVPAGNARGRVVESEGVELMDQEEVRSMVREALDAELSGAITEAVTKATDERIEAAIPAFVERVREVLGHVEESAEGPEPDPLAELRQQNSVLVSKMEELERARRVSETARLVAEMVRGAERITEAGKSRVIRLLSAEPLAEGDVEARVAEALEDERTHEAEVLRERGVRTRVVGAGAGADRSVREAYDESLETFWRNQGFTTAQIERLKEAK